MSTEYDITVIGAGPGGYVAALKAARMGARVAVVEKGHLGGACLNVGCIPSKALLASAELLHKIRAAGSMGVKVHGGIEFDWAKIQKRKDKVIRKLRGGIKGLLAAGDVHLMTGTATFKAAGTLTVTTSEGKEETIHTKNTIIATGSVPARVPGWPTDPQWVCTSDEALHWKALPKRLLIVGGGVIGCEFACMMHEYGVEVHVVEMLDGLLTGMESQLGDALEASFRQRGIRILTSAKVEGMTVGQTDVTVSVSGEAPLAVDKVLVAIWRRPNTEHLGLDVIGLAPDRGFLRVDDRMQTEVAGVYCIGDANGRCLLAHAASAQGEAAVQDALGRGEAFSLPIPSAVYTFPEVAAVGMTTREATEQGIPVKVGQFPIGYLGKAMAVGEEGGFARVVRHRDDNTLLGVHLIGHNATEIIEVATAMLTMKADTQALAKMVFAHPTLGEAVKEAAEDSFEAALHLPPREFAKVVAAVEKVSIQ